MRLKIDHDYDKLPFRSELSFRPLHRRIKTLLDDKATPYSESGRKLLAVLEQNLDILAPSITDETLAAHEDDVRLLMHFVFPELEDDKALCKAYKPYTAKPFFCTGKMMETIERDTVEMELAESTVNTFSNNFRENMLFAYTMLHEIIHDVEHRTRELVIKVHDTERNLDRYFQVDYSFNYVDVGLGELGILPREQFARLLIMQDLEALEAAMPLDDVVFQGFIFARYIEVTERENISQLKSDLVVRDALNHPDKFERIVRRLRSILQIEDLDAGLVFHYRAIRQNAHCTMRSLIREYVGDLSDVMETVYGKVFDSREAVFKPNLDEFVDMDDSNRDVVKFLKSKGIRGVGLIPLLENGVPIAILELSSHMPEVISRNAAQKLADLLPVLTIAVRQEMDEFESRIERTIKAHCTSIHPSVEWRFVEEASRYLNSGKEEGARFKDIEFKDVHPLYGSMDIRGSSTKRNKAIQGDLLDHLSLASDTLRHITMDRPIPLADYYLNELQRFQRVITRDLISGDEISVLEFLHDSVEPFFENIKNNEPSLVETVESYFKWVSPEEGFLNRRRLEYEASVSLINETLSHFLDSEEEEAQAIFPHFFEKYRTDGVEYNIYAGQSMVRGKRFEEVQLKNLRIWQLMNMCRMTRLADSLASSMDAPLKCAPLILVHSAPLSIQFRTDEKQFEVEGSYNVRYEIIKKRIDKSVVAGSGERVTQPGMLTVIYTQEREREEYEGYFRYLEDKGLIEGAVEHLSIQDESGVHGLRALRVKVAKG